MNQRKQTYEEISMRKAGFSLIEIMLVVAIMGMLAAVVAVGLTGKQKIARVNATRTSIAALSTGIKLYEMETGKLPDNLDNLLKSSGEQNWNGPYIEGGLIQPDAWGTTFGYARKGDLFEVRSAGPDKSLNTDDDLTN